MVSRSVMVAVVMACSLFASAWCDDIASWDLLTVTWNVYERAPMSAPDREHETAGHGKRVAQAPRTAHEAASAGWVLNETCSQKGVGNFYVSDHDVSYQPFYDADGHIAGTRVGVVHPFRPHTPDDWAREEWGWSVTYFFTDPATVCHAGNSQRSSVGDRLWIKRADGSFRKAPLTRDAADADSWWVEGRCFLSMGVHYWENMTEVSDCETLHSTFLLFNGGKLNGFGTVLPYFPTELPGPRWEHPGTNVIPAFVKRLPPCLVAHGRVFSTMHQFFDSHTSHYLCL